MAKNKNNIPGASDDNKNTSVQNGGNTQNKNNNQNNKNNQNQNQKQNQNRNQNKQNRHNQNQGNNGNNRNKKNKLSVKDEFELREKRLKLVYRVLFVAAILWAAVIITLSRTEITTIVAPFYAFLLSVSSVFIIRVVKYALGELRCMKIIEQADDSTKTDAETSYGYIWSLFGLSLVIHAALLLFNVAVGNVFTLKFFLITFAVCGVIHLAFNIVDLVFAILKKPLKQGYKKSSDIVGAIIINVTVYSVCSLFLMAALGNA